MEEVEKYKEYKNKVFKFFENYLPSPGVEVNQEFLGIKNAEDDNDNGLKYADFCTVRFLLQCRRLSQMMTKTWLNGDDNARHFEGQEDRIKKEKIRIRYTDKIFHLFNYKPIEKCIKRNKNRVLELCTRSSSKSIYDFLDLESNNSAHCHSKPNNYATMASAEKKEPEGSQANIRELFSYFLEDRNVLVLALFLSGQAYVVDKDKKIMQRLNEPIFTTYELIWEYELDLSWDSYYAKREDIARTGYRDIKSKPNTRVTLGLPAKPNDQSLKCENIIKWVYAKEEDGEQNAISVAGAPEGGKTEFPFYPEKGSPEWKNKQLKNVFPPYPYIILSCS